jgi:hypothetical protein
MGRQSKATFQKREKEKARMQRARDKEAQRVLAKQRRAEAGPRDEGEEDPDLAGIVPGPQPLPEQWRFAEEQAAPEETQDDA